jgi:two-component system LytT family response regulator
MFNTVIIEDDLKQVAEIKKIVNQHCPQIELIGEAYDIESGYSLIKELKPDLILLDIVMPSGTGFDLLDKLMPFDFEVIFITKHESHSFKAIKYSALDYILKPVNIQELKKASEKAIKKITAKYMKQQLDLLMTNIKNVQTSLSQKIAVPTTGGFVFILLHDIVRCEANGSYTIIYVGKKEKIMASKNIKEYESILPKTHFFRIHNSHLVNINRILRYNKGRGGSVTMEDGTEIEVATRRRSDFLNLFQ